MSKPRHPSRTMRAAHVLKCKPLCVAISHANRARVGVWQKQSFGNNASATVDAALTHAAVTGFPATAPATPANNGGAASLSQPATPLPPARHGRAATGGK